MRRLPAILVVAPAMTLLAASPVAAQQAPSLLVDPPTVATGGSVRISGTCGPAGADASIQIVLGGGVQGGQLARVETGAGGGFETTVWIPMGSPTGTGTVAAACGLGSEEDPTAPLTIVETDAPSAEAVDFVRRTHLQLLFRQPSDAAVEGFAGALDDGVLSRAGFADVIMGTAEFDAVTGAVARLYFAAFDRFPDSGGLVHWGTARQQGVPLIELARAFAASPEFTERYGGVADQAFVERLYRNILGREGDPEGVAYWTQQLTAGDLDRTGVLYEFSESPEHRILTGEEVAVSAAYVGLLGRTPDPEGFRYWVDELEGGFPRVELVRTFLDALRTGGGQTFLVAPQEAVSGPPGTAHAFGVAIRYDDRPLTGPLDVALFPCSSVRPTVSPETFRDQDGDGDADGLGVTESLDEDAVARITSVNGVATNAPVIRGTTPAQDGQLRFDVTATGPDCAAVVVFQDQSRDGELDVDVHGRPVEPYGVGQASWA